MSRFFEKVSTYQDVTLPTRATTASAGYDLTAAKDVVIDAKQVRMVPTGVKASFPSNEVLLIVARSSLPIHYGLMLPNGVGVIDSDYFNNPSNEGELFVLLYNFTEYSVTIPKGERIAQAMFTTVFTTTDDTIPTSTRTGGFGSTT